MAGAKRREGGREGSERAAPDATASLPAYFRPIGGFRAAVAEEAAVVELPIALLNDLGSLGKRGRGVRVIAGEAKGFRLKGPAGPGTRPMADKIKGALFSMLASLGVAPERVLDLYAGTGSIGIEALSRGAEWADFVEQNGAAAAVVRANLAHTKFADVSRVHQMPVATFLRQAENAERAAPYDLVILDPPYADSEIVPTLARVGASPLVQSGATVAIGHSPRVTLPEAAGRLTRLRERCHGDSCFSLYEVVDLV